MEQLVVIRGITTKVDILPFTLCRCLTWSATVASSVLVMVISYVCKYLDR